MGHTPDTKRAVASTPNVSSNAVGSTPNASRSVRVAQKGVVFLGIAHHPQCSVGSVGYHMWLWLCLDKTR